MPEKAYDINSIQSLDFREGVRTRIQMYLGSDDNEGTYQALKEIINNSTDEALAGYGNKIEIEVNEKEAGVKACFSFYATDCVGPSISVALFLFRCVGRFLASSCPDRFPSEQVRSFAACRHVRHCRRYSSQCLPSRGR